MASFPVVYTGSFVSASALNSLELCPASSRHNAAHGSISEIFLGKAYKTQGHKNKLASEGFCNYDLELCVC